MGTVTLKRLPNLSFTNEVLSEWQGRGIPRGRVSSSSLTVLSGIVPPQKNLSRGRAKRCILTRWARPKEGFLGYGARKRWGLSL